MVPVSPFDPAVRGADLRRQQEAFLDERRRELYNCLDGLTEDQARQREVRSNMTLLGLVKHATFVERVWFGEMIQGLPHEELRIAATSDESFVLGDSDTIGTVRAAYVEAWAASREIAAPLGADDVVESTPLGSLPLRWIYLHLLRELAQHCGHADIVRERILNPMPT
jgi:hypothetical protein